MNEKNKGMFLLIIGAVIVMAVVLMMYLNDKEQQGIVENYNKLYENKEANLVYFSKDGCSYCDMFDPILEELLTKFDKKVNVINAGKVNNSRLAYMLEKAEVELEEFGTPTLAVIKDGKAVDTHIGYMDRDSTFEFLKESGFIPADAVLPPEFENLKIIDYNKYDELIKSSTEQIIVIGQTTCSFCNIAKPYYDEISREENIDIYYLDYMKLSAEDREKFDKSLDYFKENPTWGTPLMLIVKNEEVTAVDSGFANKKQAEDFLKKNNIIK